MGQWRDLLEAQSHRPPTGWAVLGRKPVRALLLLVGGSLMLVVLLALVHEPGHSNGRSLATISTSFIRIPTWKWSSYSPSGRWDTRLRDDRGAEPVYALDPSSGLQYPPDINPLRLNGYRRANATFVSLVRNEEAVTMMASMRGVEDRVNRKLGYPWVFLNDEPFTEDFKAKVNSMTRAKVYFGLIPQEHWDYPAHINQTEAAERREQMANDNVIYGGSESYRKMCRYESGYFFRHPLLLKFDYYWRVEPGVEYYCDVDFDPFLFMEKNKKVYGFTISLYEYQSTIMTLWSTTQDFVRQNPHYLAPGNSLQFIVDDPSKGIEGDYNLCHFWSNFEIGDMRFWRSEAYMAYFDYLDKKGGFFYERWGDAPVHSIAVALFLPASALYQFEEIAYRHTPFMHCPSDRSKFHTNGKCFCEPDDSFDRNAYSCMSKWWVVRDKTPPLNWNTIQDQ